LLALALAYLGRKEESVAEAKRDVEIGAAENDDAIGYYRVQLLRVNILTAEPERAIDVLETINATEGYSRGWLQVDPTFDPLRANPRFRRLVARAK
jgi:hypothetical protein